MECWIQWATLVSPIISVVAIVVALCVARSSSKDAQKHITAIHNLLDVFVAANNLDIVEAQRKYQRQLAELDRQIEDAKFDVDTVYPFVGGSLIDKIEAAQKELQDVWYKVSSELYAQAQPEGNPAETILNPDGTAFTGGM